MAPRVKNHYSQIGTLEQGEDNVPRGRKTAYAVAFDRRRSPVIAAKLLETS